MDFLKIRKKAQERAGGRTAREASPASAPEAPVSAGPRAGPEVEPRPPPGEPAAPGADARGGPDLDLLAGGPLPPPDEDGFVIVRAGSPPAAPATAPEAQALPEIVARAVVPAASGDPLDEFFYREDEPGAPQLEIGLRAAPRRSEPASPVERREYLGFLLGTEEYALDIASVREILRSPAITEVPRAPTPIVGVTTVRGEVIAVFDPRLRLGLPAETTPSPRVLVCDAGGGPCGLLVDAVTQVVRLPASAIEQRPQGIGGVDVNYVSGIGRVATRLFILLNAPALFEGPRSASPEDEA